ncbi:5-(carboxyamino)imidazole ribonucleotide synthase [Vampirovibrio chlorellavorus]|uniref:5-(carboxyamino)imidazole ribonucleotide synthase n=1 Tax=Vampirovibrio chlorellavorus TaxID=758823 RepID=UPI0026F166FE|nr:5-(carboxyamino)imidazole ribonucleotide synthase [Vampirovibrio chlorellavorus]
MTASVHLPGSTLGILGSGQLGRMLALTAKRLGYRVHVFSPERDTPAGQVADLEIAADYTDLPALKHFAQGVDVVTIEFENIPVQALAALQPEVPVYPQPHVLEITQHRLREKQFLSDLGIPVVPFVPVNNLQELQAGMTQLGLPAVLKTAGFGYDGKGQVRLESEAQALDAYEAFAGQACVMERFLDLEREISVIAARAEDGTFQAYRPVENRHRNHILDFTLAPAQISETIEAQALQITQRIMEALNMRGLLCVEFFITRQGELLVNELAPRPHNSGHYTIEAAVCDQFEQQLRVVCGLPLGDPALRQPAAMANVLGDLWANGEPDWQSALARSPVYLHLYGKQEARVGRKMGHLTTLGDSVDAAFQLAKQARERLNR